MADAVEILAIGYILMVYEEAEGAVTPWEASTSRPYDYEMATFHYQVAFFILM